MRYTKGMENLKYKKAYSLYQQGYSLAEVGKVIGVTRQSVYDCFKRRGYKMRKKKLLPFYLYAGRKFTINNMGYYRSTDRKGTQLLHRYVWEMERGKIPKGYDVHHLDEDKTNNIITNLECLSKSEHTRKYSTRCNQFKCNCKKHV